MKNFLAILGGIFLVLIVGMVLIDDSEEDIQSASDFYGTSTEGTAIEGTVNDGTATDGENPDTEPGEQAVRVHAKVVHIGASEFSRLVADFNGDKDNYIGSTPCVVDFYADWCGPCKQLSPIMDKMAKKYAGRVKIYKVDVDNDGGISSAYNIESIPTLFFCSDGNIEVVTGAPSEEQLESMISEL